MKKLLLLISLCLFTLLFFACKNPNKAQQREKAEQKPELTNPIATDTTTVKSQTEPAGTTNNNGGIKLDPNATNQSIIHGNPDPQKLDSVKNAKTKYKH